MRPLCVLVAVGMGLVACGGPAKSPSNKASDQVPANSLDDDRLHGTQAGKPPPPQDDYGNDPTQPYIMKVGEAPPPDDASGDAPPAPTGGKSATGKGAATGGKTASGGKGAISKAECDKALDKYLTLQLSSDPRLKGLDPAILEQVKQQGRQQHGEAPCDKTTRAQYNCAMGASSPAAWETCMK